MDYPCVWPSWHERVVTVARTGVVSRLTGQIFDHSDCCAPAQVIKEMVIWQRRRGWRRKNGRAVDRDISTMPEQTGESRLLGANLRFLI